MTMKGLEKKKKKIFDGFNETYWWVEILNALILDVCLPKILLWYAPALHFSNLNLFFFLSVKAGWHIRIEMCWVIFKDLDTETDLGALNTHRVMSLQTVCLQQQMLLREGLYFLGALGRRWWGRNKYSYFAVWIIHQSFVHKLLMCLLWYTHEVW